MDDTTKSPDSKPTDQDERPPDTPQKVSIDWALKRLLRSKANFKVLEGLWVPSRT